MTDLSEMPTRELCERLRFNAKALLHPDEVMLETARRLERYAPVRIDPEDEGTWPTEGDATDLGLVSVWDSVTKRWWDCDWRYAHRDPDNTHWRRINNEPPE